LFGNIETLGFQGKIFFGEIRSSATTGFLLHLKRRRTTFEGFPHFTSTLNKNKTQLGLHKNKKIVSKGKVRKLHITFTK